MRKAEGATGERERDRRRR